MDGKEVAFTASEKLPATLDVFSLNHNLIGWEGAKAINGTHVEINGSTVTYNKDYGYVYAEEYNRQEDVGIFGIHLTHLTNTGALHWCLQERDSLHNRIYPNGMDQINQVAKPTGPL